jgi:hypothetical protein
MADENGTVDRRYAGADNYGRPKSNYLQKISEMDDSQLSSECYSMIYQSARCDNNPRADWHWMVDACYDEAKRRDAEASIYVRAYERCYREHAR